MYIVTKKVELLWDSKLHDPLLLITGRKKEIKLQFPHECLPVYRNVYHVHRGTGSAGTIHPGEPIGALDNFCSLALTASFSPSILIILDANMLHVHYILLATFVRQPLLHSMTEPHFASYTSPTSYVIYNGKITRHMEHRRYHAYTTVALA